MVTLLEAGYRQCRTPLWGATLPAVDQMFVCGAATRPGRSYCPACEKRLIAGRTGADGEAVWFQRVNEKAAGTALRQREGIEAA